MYGEQDFFHQGISAALEYFIMILLCHISPLKNNDELQYLRLDLHIANISFNCAPCFVGYS